MYMGQIITTDIYLEQSNIPIFGTISLYNMYILQINQKYKHICLQYLQMSFYLSLFNKICTLYYTNMVQIIKIAQTNFQRCVKPYDQKLLITLDIAD